MKDYFAMRVRIGIYLTIGWVIGWAILLGFNWDTARLMRFNEWGDFFAGVSGPLALAWLVVGYFQQGEELQKNTTALGKQEEALLEQVAWLKKDFDLTVSNHHTEMQLDWENHQPVIILEDSNLIYHTPGTLPKEGDNYKGQFINLISSKHNIKDISFKLEHYSNEYLLENDTLAHWPADNSHKINLLFTGESQHMKKDLFQLHMTYFDTKGRKGRMVWECTPNGKMSIAIALLSMDRV